MAGLLSSLGRSAWSAVDPLVPDEQVMGLLNRARGMGAPPAGPVFQPQGAMTPGTAPMAAERQGPGRGELMSRFIFKGQLPGDVRDEHAKREAQARYQQQVEQAARDANLSPQDRLAMLLNGEQFGKSLATNSEAANVGGGDSRYTRQGVFTAPRMVEDEGVYGTQTPDGYVQTGQRSKSYDDLVAEQNAAVAAARQEAEARIAQVRAELTRQQVVETGRHNRATEGLGYSVHNARMRQGGYGTPGVGMVLGTQLGSEWEDIN